MLIFWASKLLALSVLNHGCSTFMLDSSTVGPNGENHYITTSQFAQLMNSLTVEKQVRHQLEQIVARLQTKVDASTYNGGKQLKNMSIYLQPYISRLENLTSMQKTFDSRLQTKEAEITRLCTKVAILEQNCVAIKIDSHKLNQEVESLKQVKNLDVANGLQETNNAINMLKATSQARSEDFRALYNLTMLNNKDISLAKQQLTDIYNGSTIDKKIKRLNDKMTNVNTTVLGLTTKGFITDSKIKDLIDKTSRLDNSHNLTSQLVKTNYQTLTTKVGFTSCGGSILSGGRLNFPLVKSSHGIYVPSYYRDGKFSPNKAGFYLLVANILSSNQGGYFIRKNGQEIARSWSHYSDSDHTARFSAPISAFMQLSVYNVITIHGASTDFSSCLTIVQL